MICPRCGYHDSKVLDSREAIDGIRRRRECLKCGGRFTTYEKIQQHVLLVVKKDKRREQFDKGKILSGIRKACEKRPISAHIIEGLANDIEAELLSQGKAEIPGTLIGDMVMEKLKALDQIAYIRFASVYREFTDITRLKEEVDNLAGISENPKTPSTQLPLIPETEVGEKVRAVGRRR